MKPDRLPHPQSLVGLITELGNVQLPLEFVVVKAHLISERHMYALLSFRLDIEEQELPALMYFPLAKLALGGSKYNATFQQVVALNELRNDLSHELLSNKTLERMKVLAKRTKVFWPTWTEDGSETLPFGGDRAVRMACGLCLGDLWCHVVEAAIAQGRYRTAETLETARQELALFRAAQAQRRSEERSIEELCEWLKQQAAELGALGK